MASIILALLMLLTESSAYMLENSSNSVQFLTEPVNVTVREGDSTFMPCSFVNTAIAPFWEITLEKKMTIKTSSSTLPPNFTFNGSGIIFDDVKVSLSQSTYTCYLMYTAKGMRGFQILRSSTGTITVIRKAPLIFKLELGMR